MAPTPELTPQHSRFQRFLEYWKTLGSDVWRLTRSETVRNATVIPEPDVTRDESKFPPLEHMDRLFQIVSLGYKTQSEELDRIERKATTMLAVIGVLAGLSINGAARLSRGWPAVLCLAAGLLALLIALVSGTMVVWPETTKGAPDPTRTVKTGYSPPTNRLLASAIVAMSEAARENVASGLRLRRVRWLRRQLRGLLAGLFLLVLAFMSSSVPILA